MKSILTKLDAIGRTEAIAIANRCEAERDAAEKAIISFAMTENHQPLTDPLAGYDKYLLVAGAAAGMATLVSLYSLFVVASKVIPRS
jgi:hypothetical protein